MALGFICSMDTFAGGGDMLVVLGNGVYDSVRLMK